eukprot:2164202-Amphidinium_carterae.1
MGFDNALMEPKGILACVMGIVQPCAVQDVVMIMAWIELKKKYEVTLKSFAWSILDGLLRELIVKLRLRRNNVRVESLHIGVPERILVLQGSWTVLCHLCGACAAASANST